MVLQVTILLEDGGYYTKGDGDDNITLQIGYVGGEGASDKSSGWYTGHSGSGGTAGTGGIIIYSEFSKLNAYNGDRITNEKYDEIYYEYDKDGKITENKLSILEKKNGKKFIPAYVFAQAGISRKVYYGNWSSAKTLSELSNILFKDEYNIDSYIQGIGSGAGYIELSNGTFELSSELN